MKTLLSCLLLLVTPSLRAQGTRYEVSFPNAAHHEAEIVATFSQLPPAPLRVRMSRSSPGRYATHEFAKNIYRVKATDGGGAPLALVRADPDTWEIPVHGETVKVAYTLFGNLTDGTYTDIDPVHAHLNMPATFLWAKGLENQPVTVAFQPPASAGWKVATQLKPTEQPYVFTAPHQQYFMDSPTELSNFSLREWTVANPDRKPLTLRLAIHHDGTEGDVDEYLGMVKKVVREQQAIFGELPDYDFGTYTFLQDVLPGNDGDGMEHRNSTIISDNASLRTDKQALLSTVAHEFFHGWNVERIRPKTLEPFDFERANMSGELWFAEGFTNYYGELTLARAGFYDAQRYAQSLSGQLNAVLNSPGTYAFSPVEMSQQAPFVDAATAVDPTNFANVFTSYYPYGCVVALALDLSLRAGFRNLTLDDYLRAVWKAHGKTEKPYTVADLQQLLINVTRDSTFANAFFRQHVRGHEVADYRALLAKAGLLLRKARPGVPYLGQPVGVEGERVVVTSGTLVGSPLYQAGLDRGDVIVSLDEVPLRNADDYQTVLAKHQPGDAVNIRYEHRGTTRNTSITFVENPLLEVVPHENASVPLTREMKTFRANWLGSKVADK
ncbi:MAG: M61 family metallopeptidase [Ferruginibacter sp.]|nr:M61 family metallopeptidase [Cytophagales bacterium]